MKILFLTKYDRLGASSRMRSLQYIPFLESRGVTCVTNSFLSDDLLENKYASGRYPYSELLKAYARRLMTVINSSRFDLVWIEKEAFPWFPASVEIWLLRQIPYVLDYDDAVFHAYDLHANHWLRMIFGRRLDHLMHKATLVVAGNGYLAQRAVDAGAGWVEILPTVVDMERYNPMQFDLSCPPCIVWIGSPSTAHYLEALRVPLKQLAAEIPFVLRVIGAKDVVIAGVDVELVPWTESTEVAAIASCAIGIMPLEDSPWEKGKCGYKLIQYMACGLPVVASPVGVNVDIVDEGCNGFLAATSEQWVRALGRLLKSPPIRQGLGRAGRRLVEQNYCLQKTAPRLLDLLRRASER